MCISVLITFIGSNVFWLKFGVYFITKFCFVLTANFRNNSLVCLCKYFTTCTIKYSKIFYRFGKCGKDFYIVKRTPTNFVKILNCKRIFYKKMSKLLKQIEYHMFAHRCLNLPNFNFVKIYLCLCGTFF